MSKRTRTMLRFYMEPVTNLLGEYELLATAIIKQAVNDYCNASIKIETLRQGQSLDNAKRLKADCVKFFKSGWYDILSPVPGDYIMERCDECVKRCIQNGHKTFKVRLQGINEKSKRLN